MGLDLHPGRPDPDSQSGWSYRSTDPHPQWSYGGFDEFRTRLAAEEGFSLDAMQGFGGHAPWDGVTTALKPLLNHSDCDRGAEPRRRGHDRSPARRDT